MKKKNLIFISTHEPNNVEFYDLVFNLETHSYLPRKALILAFPSVSQFDTFVQTASPDFSFSLLIHLGKYPHSTVLGGELLTDEIKALGYYSKLNYEYTSRGGESEYDNRRVHHLAKLVKKDFNLEGLPETRVSDLHGISGAIAEKRTEFAILTALFDDEHAAFDQNMKSSPIDTEKNIKKGRYLEAKDFDDDYRDEFLTCWQQNMGTVDAAAFSSRLIATYAPKYLIMGGVCGGRKDDVNLYDVIIPNNIHDYMSGKFKKGVFTPRPLRAEPNQELIGFLETRKKQIKDNMRKLATGPLANIIDGNFKIHFKNYACGNLVIKTGNVLEDIAKSHDEDIIGLEMESLGVIRATNLFQKNNQYGLVVKSVMDFTDEHKKDGDGGMIKTNAAWISYLCIRAIMPILKDFKDVKL